MGFEAWRDEGVAAPERIGARDGEKWFLSF